MTFKTLDELQPDLNGKVAVAIRTARAAAGLNQQDFSEMMGVAKSTIARIETLEGKANADFLLECVYFFKSIGIEIELHDYDNLIIKVSNEAINTAASNLEDVTKRRSDRKVKE
jgi:transcriptional regulator with XRE-family HTH domain